MKKQLTILITISLALTLSLFACCQKKTKVFFSAPLDKATVETTFQVKMATLNLTVEPAGEIHEKAGHHHIIIDGNSIAKGTAVAKDETHLHFGKGQTETELTLEPGEHTLTLQFADGAHVSYGKELSQTISITVK